MRIQIFLIAVLVIFSSCSSTENASRTGSAAPESDFIEETSPEWYNQSVESSVDANTFYGYSHAIASGREEAAELSEDLAISNLRFEIDRYVERVRSTLEDELGGDPYSTGRFIINLRNAVQTLEISSLNPETEYFEQSGVTNSFTRISISIDDVAEKLSDKISDTAFIRSLRNGID